mmetsp:Transcript_58551/g.122365  ORF Transcript_58551/g.122365 Transcript_58551/m.122365 type:complete len:188 (-) Transcript_58551:41-604(-)
MVEILTENRGIRGCCRNKLRISMLSRNRLSSSFGLFCLLLASAVLIVAGDISRDESNEELNADDSKPQGVRLGYVLNTLQDGSDEPKRMKFPGGAKFSAEKGFAKEEDRRLEDDPDLPQCTGGHLDEEDESLYNEASDGPRSRFSVARVERFIKMIEPIKDPIKALFGIGLLFHGRSFAHLILFTQV